MHQKPVLNHFNYIYRKLYHKQIVSSTFCLALLVLSWQHRGTENLFSKIGNEQSIVQNIAPPPPPPMKKVNENVFYTIMKKRETF